MKGVHLNCLFLLVVLLCAAYETSAQNEVLVEAYLDSILECDNDTSEGQLAVQTRIHGIGNIPPKQALEELLVVIRKRDVKSLSLRRIRANVLVEYSEFQFSDGNLRASLASLDTACSLLKALDRVVEYLTARTNLGLAYYELGNTVKAIECHLESVAGFERINLDMELAASLNNLALCYMNLGNTKDALAVFYRSLKLCEMMSFLPGQAYNLQHIGIILEEQGDRPESIRITKRGVELFKASGELHEAARGLLNLALYYQDSDVDTSRLLIAESLALRQSIGDKRGYAEVMITYGNQLCIFEDYKAGFRYLLNGFDSLKRYHNPDWQGIAAGIIGNWYNHLNQTDSAWIYAEIAHETGLKNGYPKNIKRSSLLMSLLAGKKGDCKHALYLYKLHVKMKDSLNNQETQKNTIRQQTQYEFEKTQLVKQQAANEQARIKNDALNRRDNLQYSVIFIVLLLIFGGIAMLGFVRVSPWLAEGLIFFSFLILFEFLLVLADPTVEEWSGGAPGYKLFFNAVLAGLIFPMHLFFEKILKTRLIKSARK